MVENLLGPTAMALLAALQFALVVLFVRKGLDYADATTGTAISIAVATLVFWVTAPLYVERHYWASPALLIFGAVGLFRPSLSTWLSNAATLQLGPTIAATVGGIAPVFAVAGGVLLLSEPLTAPVAVGTAGIVAGVMVLSSRGRGTPGGWAKIALLLPLTAAVLRAIAQVMTKWGLDILPDPFMAGLMGFSVSLLLTAPLALARRRGAPRRVHRLAWVWFSWSGLANAGAVMAINLALRDGYVVYVGPLTASFPLFTLLLSLLFFRQETFTSRVVAGLCLIFLGVTEIIVLG